MSRSFSRCAGNRRVSDALRRGAVAVEFAITVPFLFLILFGSIEFSRANMLRQTVSEAAYEAARRGTVPGATADAVKATADRLLKAASTRSYTISVSPTTILSTTPEITCTVSVPLSQNAWGKLMFTNKTVLTRSFTLRREQYIVVGGP